MIEEKKTFMQHDLISIVIPIYNVQDYLNRCVESVLKQTYSRLEIILVDDGSTDSSGEICDSLQGTDDRIVVVHKKNGGLSDARNAGIEISTGKYLFFLDADDYLASNAIELMHSRIIAEKADLVICNFTWTNSKGEKFCREDIICDEVLNRDELQGKLVHAENFYYVVAWNKLYDKKLFDGLRFAFGKIHEDEFIVHHIFGRCNKAASIVDVLYYYIKTDNSITSTNTNIKRLDYIEALDDRIKYFDENGYNAYAVETIKLLWWAYSELYISVNIFNENRNRMKELKVYFNKYFVRMILLYKRSIITIGELIVFRINPQWYKKMKRGKK